MTFARKLQQASLYVPPQGGGGGGGGGGTSTGMLMGSSMKHAVPGGYDNWDTLRCYNFGKVDDAVALGAKLVCLTDEDSAPVAGGQSSANALNSALNTIFNNHPNLEVHFANGNEVDRENPNMTNYKATMAAMRTVVDNHVALGHKVSLWIDLTINNVKNSPTVEANFKAAAAQYLDGIACSMYPAGRNQDPPVFTAYSQFIDPVFALAQSWGIDKVSCWETGIQPDPNDKQKRPTYAAGLAKHIHDVGVSYGIATPAACWWDSQKAGGPDDSFTADAPGTNPTTAAAWRDWPSYT